MAIFLDSTSHKYVCLRRRYLLATYSFLVSHLHEHLKLFAQLVNTGLGCTSTDFIRNLLINVAYLAISHDSCTLLG